MPSIQRVCSIQNCQRLMWRANLCSSHHHRRARYGDPEYPVKERDRSNSTKYTLYPEYNTWSALRARCNNPKDKRYSSYGGRGITVCKRWDKFENFYADMGPRPEGMTLDRIDVNGNYEPSNCRWTTTRIQNLNRRVFPNNTSGYTGIHKNKNRWVVKLNSKEIGRFINLEDAVNAREKALDAFLDSQL